MKFDPATHTKEFLLSNPSVALNLAEKSSAFAISDLVNDFEVLQLVNEDSWSVAHWLAGYQTQWIHSEAAKSFEILKLANIDDWTVAHVLAVNQSEWIHSEAAKSFEILQLTDNGGNTVAGYMVQSNEDCLNHEPLFQKQILTLEHEGKSLAEYISQKYKFEGFDIPVMAMKLISQGAAYKHSEPIDLSVGEAILKHSKKLIEDSLEPLIALKQLQALYSTFSHNVSKIISTQEQKTLQKWQSLLLQSENLIRQHLAKNPSLYDIEHTVDILCEPGDDLLKKLKSERILASDLTSLSGMNNASCSEQEPKIQNLY